MLSSEKLLALKKLNNIPFQKGTIIAHHRNGAGGFSVVILANDCELPKYDEELFHNMYRSNIETVNVIDAITNGKFEMKFGNLDFPFVISNEEFETYKSKGSYKVGDTYLYELLSSKHEMNKIATI